MSLQQDQVHDFLNKYREGRITRRQLLSAASLNADSA